MVGYETERKFLVDMEKWELLDKPEKEFYRQGYLYADAGKTIRVRQTDTKGFLTIKGMAYGFTRQEFEYEIPFVEAGQLLDTLAASCLSKHRYKLHHGNHLWEIDQFLGENEGLLIAEIELKSETEEFEIPLWVGKEVTGDAKYYNARLSVNPYKNW